MKKTRLHLSLFTAVLVFAACTVPPEHERAAAAAPAQAEEPAPPPPPIQPLRRELAASDAKAAATGAAAAQRHSLAPPPVIAAEARPEHCCWQQPQPEDRENYARLQSNRVQRVAENPVSTFSIDVDTGSYANVRRFLKEGRLPPADAVRVEELINYFDYADAPPRDPSLPFGIHTELAAAPWNAKTQLLRIGIQGWKSQGPRKSSNLVFLVDVSGSMNESNKLPLVKASLKLLAGQLRREDRISLVVYAGSSGVVLEPTPGDQTAKINAALDRLEAGGSTNGGEGILSAYAMAQQGMIPGGNNRVLLATDGDFNVGVTRFESLLELVAEKRKTGIALTTLGFGTGNYNDHLMEQLADAGDGNYAYLDSLSEAQKTLFDQRDATLQTIARDVKIQIEFNPAQVAEYRLIGYENRLLQREDFNNDKIDAGDIGAGHRVTALYEVALVDGGGARIEPLRYQDRAAQVKGGQELAYVRLRYKRPEDGMQAASRLIERSVSRSDIGKASDSWRLAAAVAAFGQLLRGGQYTEGFRYTDVEQLARAARGDDRNGYAGEFLQMVKLAQSLSTQQASAGGGSD